MHFHSQSKNNLHLVKRSNRSYANSTRVVSCRSFPLPYEKWLGKMFWKITQYRSSSHPSACSPACKVHNCILITDLFWKITQYRSSSHPSACSPACKVHNCILITDLWRMSTKMWKYSSLTARAWISFLPTDWLWLHALLGRLQRGVLGVSESRASRLEYVHEWF